MPEGGDQPPKDERQERREERREWRRSHRGPFLIPAGVLLGLGIGLLVNQPGAGVLIGLGLGFLGSALIRAASPVPPGVPGFRWAFVAVGIVLVLLGLAVVTGWALPWTYLIATLLIILGIGFVIRGFGRMT